VGQGQPVDDRPRTHACVRPLPLAGRSPYQRSPAPGCRGWQHPPGSSTDRGKTPVPTVAGPAPDHPGPPTR